MDYQGKYSLANAVTRCYSNTTEYTGGIMDINEALNRCDGNVMLNAHDTPRFGGFVTYQEIDRCEWCGSVLDNDGSCENCDGAFIGREDAD